MPMKKGIVGLCAAVLYVGRLCGGENQTPPAEAYDGDLFNKDKTVWFFNAEFLYWLANESALDYAISMNRPVGSENTAAIGNYKKANFGWSPGFRVNFGHFNAPHYWDVFGQYTYVPCFGRDHANAPKAAGQFLNGTWIEPDVGQPPIASLQSATSTIDLQYHLIDLLFTRRFHTNNHLRINVFGGPTAAFFYQKWKVHYLDTKGLSSKLRNRWQFQGIGLRLGLKFDWFLGCDLYLTGLVSNGLLSGWYKNSAFQTTTAPVDAANPVIRDSHLHDNRLTYTAQFLTGPSWQKRFTNIRTELFAGYEFTIWTNLHEVYRSSFGPPHAAKETFINDSNLSFQGLTVRLNVDF